MATVVDLLRHGEPEGGRLYRGQRDDPLTERGWQQMRSSCEGGEWDVIVTSPLVRCRAFGEELAAARDLVCDADDGLAELDYGVWEGLTPEVLRMEYADAYAAYCDNPELSPPPGGEALTAFQKRVLAAWQGILERHRDRRILLIAHTGVLRILLLAAMGAPLSRYRHITIPYAGLSRLVVSDEPGAMPTQWLWHGRTEGLVTQP